MLHYNRVYPLFAYCLTRATDFMLVLIVFYTLTVSFLLQLSYDVELILHSAHALAWCIFHCFGLGLLLRAQGERKFLVRHFMKHYYYPPNDGGIGAIQEAFTNWKSIYNLSLCMTYGAYIKVVALSFFSRVRLSVLHRPRLENILVPKRMDCWKRSSPSHSRRCTFFCTLA